jgi:carbonic anhydrase
MNKELQEKMIPEEALNRLLQGNLRFVDKQNSNSDLMEQVHASASGQYPFAAVLGCIDSRVPAELVFDQGIGDIFNARVAGNIVNEDILGSLEYACKVAGSKLILVLGHTACGAVTAACNRVELGNITPLLSKITPAVDFFGEKLPEVDEVSRKNVRMSIERIKTESEILMEMVNMGEIQIRGGMYDVASGKVSLLD